MKTWILLELSQLLTGHLFNAGQTSTQALGGSLLQSSQGLVWTSRLSGLDSCPCGGTEAPGFVIGAAARGHKAQVGMDTTRMSIAFFFFFFLILPYDLTLGGAEAFFLT